MSKKTHETHYITITLLEMIPSVTMTLLEMIRVTMTLLEMILSAISGSHLNDNS